MNDRVYCYVDGSNAIRSFGNYLNENIRSDFPPFEVFSLMQESLDLGLRDILEHSDWRRAHWFGSFSGSDIEFRNATRRLKDIKYDPFLIRKKKRGPEKQVDTQLVTKLLTDSFKQLMNLAVVVSGDIDYLNAIKEVRKNGQDVIVVGFGDNSNLDLLYEADEFIDLNMVLSNNIEKDPLKLLIEKIKKQLNEDRRFTKNSIKPN